MRRPSLRSAALVGGLAIALPSATLLGTPADAAAAPGRALAAAAGTAVQCRTATIRPSADVSATGKSCIRLQGGHWIGSGSVTIVARKRLSGFKMVGAVVAPNRPGTVFDLGDIALQPGRPQTIPLKGSILAKPGDKDVTWRLWFTVSEKPGETAGFAAVTLSSPAVGRTSATTRPRTFARSTPWQCTVRPVSGYSLAGTAKLCLRQVRSTVEVRGTLTYTASDIEEVRVGPVLDGRVDATDASFEVLPSAAPRTVALPTITSQVLRRDLSAGMFLQLTSGIPPFPAPVRSTPLRLR